MDQLIPPPLHTPPVFKYFLLLFGISILLLGYLFWPFIPILVLSYLLTGIFKPAYNLLHRRLAASIASLLTCLLIILLVFLPVVFFAAALSQEAFALYQLGKEANLALRVRELVQENTVIAYLQEYLVAFGIKLEPESFSAFLSELAKMVGLFLYNQASSWATNIASFIFSFFLMIVIIYFLLIENERLISFVMRLSPLPDHQERQLINKFDDIAWALLFGNGVCGIIQGVLGGAAFAVLGLSSPVLWGGIMAILAFLPIFGIGLVMIPAAFILLLKGNIVSFVILLLFYMTLSFSMEYLLKPKLVGSQVKMPTLLVFLAIIGGLSGFGVIGLIYGPLIVTGFLTLADIYQASYARYVQVEGEDVRPAG
jgi:predicted PurR-regulated permease PerM